MDTKLLSGTYTKETTEYLSCAGYALEGLTLSNRGGSLIFAEDPKKLPARKWVYIMVMGDMGLVWKASFEIELNGSYYKPGRIYTFERV